MLFVGTKYVRNGKLVILANNHTTLKKTSSRPITEVKQRWARSVLGWVTAWEHRVSLAFVFFSSININEVTPMSR